MHVQEAPERCHIKHGRIAATREQEPEDNHDQESANASVSHDSVRIGPVALGVYS
jgi:hypothetical protein